MTKRNNYQTKKKVGDYVSFCDICRMHMWASEGTILETETGRGGLFVCKIDRDAIDYGLIPWGIPADEPVPIARDAHYASNPSAVPNSESPFNFNNDPMTG